MQQPSQRLSRRALIPALCTASGLVASRTLWSQSGGAKRPDLHHHFASPKFKALLAEGKRQGWETFQPYDPNNATGAMDKGGVATAFLSVTTPGLYQGDDFNHTERDRAIAMART